MMLWLLRRYIRKQIANGHIDELMLEVVHGYKQVWYEDNVYTANADLKEHLSNAIHYEYQIYSPLD